MTLTRKQHIARIADKCVVSWFERRGQIIVDYDNLFANYAISAEGKTRWIGGNREDVSQYVIDGMRLAAQRVIDKRSSKSDLLDKLRKSLQLNSHAYDPFAGESWVRTKWDAAAGKIKAEKVNPYAAKPDGPAIPEPPITLAAIRQIVREEIERLK